MSSLHKLQHGDMANVAAMERIIAQMQDQQIFASGLPMPVRSYWGTAPNINAVITGQPKTMYRRKRSENLSITAPISIFVDTVVSDGLSESAIINRGVAIMAFTMAMNIIRPVELTAIALGNPHGYSKKQIKAAYGSIVKLDTKPIDLARASFALTSKEYCRGLAFSCMRDCADTSGCGIAWPWSLCGAGNPTSQEYIDTMRHVCGASSNDVLVVGGHLTDRLMLTDPIAWVKQMLAKHNGAAAE